jgi:hypothetical protein
LWRNEPPAWFSWHSELCNLVSLLLLAIRYMYNTCYEIVGRNFSNTVMDFCHISFGKT